MILSTCIGLIHYMRFAIYFLYMNSLRDLLLNKANDIDIAAVKDDIDVIQAELDRFFSGGIHLSKIQNGSALVTAQSAPMAANFRMQQHQLVEDLNSSLRTKLTKFVIRIA